MAREPGRPLRLPPPQRFGHPPPNSPGARWAGFRTRGTFNDVSHGR